MDTKIVWVYGSSAAGKETLIKKLIDNPDEKLLTRFGFQGYHLVELSESRKWIKQYNDDPVALNRKNFSDLIRPLLLPKTVVLIKGQDVDLEYKTPEKLLDMYPDVVHEIIFLTLPIEEIYKRCKKKSWWVDGEDTKEELEEWLEIQIEELRKLKGFSISAYDSSTLEYKKSVWII